MDTLPDPLLDAIQATAADNVQAVLDARAMSKSDLVRAVGTRRGAAKKTVYNVLNKKHPPNIGTLLRVSKTLEIPLWALLVPGLAGHKELLGAKGLEPLVKVVENYLAASPANRAKIERMAQAMRDEADLDR